MTLLEILTTIGSTPGVHGARGVLDPAAPGLAACREITAARARNFYLGLRLAPEPKRSALLALYAWMREADDLADAAGAGDTGETRAARLAELGARTGAVLARRGEAGSAGAGAATWWSGFEAMVRAYPVPDSVFTETLEALGRDARADVMPVEHRTSADLAWYTDRVAGTVAVACVSIWGLRRGWRDGEEAGIAARAERLAVLRARAVQITNILRDLREDLDEGLWRSYLPSESYERHGLTAQDLLAWRDGARCARFIGAWAAEARRLYEASDALESVVHPSCARVSWALAAVYRALLEEIARDPARVARERVSVRRRRKMGIALAGYLGVGLPG